MRNTQLIAGLALALAGPATTFAVDPVDYLRLTVETPAERLKDDGNLIGHRPDALRGYDANDLVEMPPMAPPYLTLVFPRQDRGVQAKNYTTDFRPVSPYGDAWYFEVHSDNPDRQVTLRWTGDIAWMQRSTLIDQDLNERIQVVPGEYYSFSMEGRTERSFTWRLAAEGGATPSRPPVERQSKAEFSGR